MAALRAPRSFALAVTLAVLPACGGGAAATASQTAAGSPQASSSGAQNANTSQAGPQITVRTATAPTNDCDWLPVGDVEAIVGKLAAPPVKRDGCRYTLVMPDQLRELREKEIRSYEASHSEMGAILAKKTKESADPRNYAMTLSVEWNGSADMMQITRKTVEKLFAAELGTPAGSTSDRAKPSTGWDDEGGLPYGYTGRLGHVRIIIQGESPDVPTEPMARLAARVRDRIPDLPFPAKNTYQVMTDAPANADPCGLVTRAEAEAVLGPLVVDPYRSSSYFPPLAHPTGHACAYFTAGHHVFVLTPLWTGGAKEFALNAGIGGLVRQVMPQEDVILKGPWDKSQITMDGALDFLKGDRLLEVNFAMSSTDRLGALKLATLGMGRLSAMPMEAAPRPTDVRAAPGAGGTAPGWSRTLKLSDGRTMVADAAFVLDAAIAKPASLPSGEASAATIEKFLTADLPFEIPITGFATGRRPGTYIGPGNVQFNADYIDYLRRTLPENRVRVRMGPGRPAVILFDGKPVGLIMPLA
ncbi:MAG TPA: hypothetical protein VL484_20715 [Vicinamibacterales bacterium]|jgi:hypothetical protein|nr:hypothetical protein [Vicinamibacterales bacterium]